jgi:L-ascorbate metabolism protein UlaG (beta-lactamase superfamily)
MRTFLAFLSALCVTTVLGCGPSSGTQDQTPDTAKEEIMIDIHWHGHDTFRIVDDAKQIYFDPYKLPDGLPKADVIFITHSHGDHFSKQDVSRLLTATTRIVAPADVTAEAGPQATTMKPGDEIAVGALKVRAVPAYNINKFRSPGNPFHPKDKNWVGYIVTLSNGVTVYHAGDTDFIPEMKDIRVDVALLPVSGTYVMTAPEAAEAANVMMPKLAIPMHYGAGVVGTVKDAETFAKAFKGKTRIMTLEK